MEIKKFKKDLIAFDFDSETVNATDMLKSFPDKRINDFLRLKQTKDYKKELESVAGIPVTVIKQGGKEQGTWMHKLLAYKFASWLSPKFELFVYSIFDKEIKKKLEKAKAAKRAAEIREGYAWNALDRNDLYQS